jgi:hypothetical protein
MISHLDDWRAASRKSRPVADETLLCLCNLFILLGCATQYLPQTAKRVTNGDPKRLDLDQVWTAGTLR